MSKNAKEGSKHESPNCKTYATFPGHDSSSEMVVTLAWAPQL